MMVNKSLALVALGERGEAEACYRRALAWKPTDLTQYARLKKILNLGEPQAERLQQLLEGPLPASFFKPQTQEEPPLVSLPPAAYRRSSRAAGYRDP